MNTRPANKALQDPKVVRHLKLLYVVAFVLIFVGLPVAFYALGDFPRRSALKEAISLATIIAFSSMLGQFFLARSNMDVIALYSLKRVKTVHKVIAYTAVSVILLHPVLIVLPRALEGGIDPLDAFVTMLTTVDNLGIVAGIVAWLLLFTLVTTSFFRIRIIKALHTKYPTWRYVHGGLAVGLVAAALVHAIDLGRHTTLPLAAFFLTVTALGVGLLARMYFVPERT